MAPNAMQDGQVLVHAGAARVSPAGNTRTAAVHAAGGAGLSSSSRGYEILQQQHEAEGEDKCQQEELEVGKDAKEEAAPGAGLREFSGWGSTGGRDVHNRAFLVAAVSQQLFQSPVPCMVVQRAGAAASASTTVAVVFHSTVSCWTLDLIRMSEQCTERGTGAALRLHLPLACIVALFDCALNHSHNQDLFLINSLPPPPLQACNAPDPAAFKSVYNGHALFLNAGADLPEEDLLKHWRQDVRVTCDLMLAAEEAVGLAPGKKGIVELLKRWNKGPTSMQELEKATTEMLRERAAAGGGVVPGGDYLQSRGAACAVRQGRAGGASHAHAV
jgi:hypothetical protein